MRDEAFRFTFTWHRPDTEPIAITAHQHNEASDSPEPYAKFYGTAPPGTHVTARSEHGAAETTTNDNGEWLVKIWFGNDLPTNTPIPITVIVGDEAFRFTFTWHQDQPEPVPFSAHQVKGSSTDPFEVMWGTAPPGSTIQVKSKFGSASTVANDQGEWEVGVHFDGAPRDRAFTVKAKHDGQERPFSFTWLSEKYGHRTHRMTRRPTTAASSHVSFVLHRSSLSTPIADNHLARTARQ